MQAAWDWLSGKKMIIASIAGILLAFNEQVLIAIWQVQTAIPWIGKFDDSISWFIMIVGGAGSIHKIVKLATGQPQNPNETIAPPGRMG